MRRLSILLFVCAILSGTTGFAEAGGLQCRLRVRSVELVPFATFPLYPHEPT
jgi:hypothetical protein